MRTYCFLSFFILVGCYSTENLTGQLSSSSDEGFPEDEDDSSSGDDDDDDVALDDDDSVGDDDDTVVPWNAATIGASVFPAQVACGSSSEVSIEVINSGTTTWTHADGYKLGTVGDEDPLHEAHREWLAEDASIAPGSSWQFEFEILAPATEGTFTSDWRMVQEAVEWFGDSVSFDVVVSCPEEDPAWEYTSAVEDAIFVSASWVRDNYPGYFDLEAMDGLAKRTIAYEMMTTVINDLRAEGIDASRCVANPGLPLSDPYYWCSDALVVGPPGVGVTVDIYQSWSYPANPQTFVTGTGSTGVVTSDLVQLGLP